MIWVIGGTSDAVQITRILSQGQNVLVTTTTQYGAELAQGKGIKVFNQSLTGDDMRTFIHTHQIDTVVDASHPFAYEASQNAIAACSACQIRYMRYERQKFICPEAHYYAGYDQLSSSLNQTKGQILLTIGSKNLNKFSVISSERIVAKVLPVVSSIEQCRAAGLKMNQIIAMKGRLGKEANKSLMEEYKIEHMVTKDAGDAGGLQEKTEAALELGIQIHMLERPHIQYPEVYNQYEMIYHQLANN